MNPRHRSTTALLAACVLVGVVALGTWNVERSRGEPLDVVGDSMAYMASTALKSTGESAGYDVRVDGIPGDTLAQRMGVVQQVSNKRSDNIVVELGTNDVLQGVPQADVDARIDRAISYLVNARCVVFVDVGILLGPVAEARRFNEHLTAAVQSHPNMHVYDWAADFQQHPDWTVDTVHLKAPYIERYAHAIIDTTRSSCRT